MTALVYFTWLNTIQHTMTPDDWFKSLDMVRKMSKMEHDSNILPNTEDTFEKLYGLRRHYFF
jgi:hypothetical protein